MTSPEASAGSARHLIPSRQVHGAKIYNTALEDLGTIDDVVIDCDSGRVAYAVLSCGGFLGLGERHYPMPWEKLRYNSEMGGYIVDVEREVLQAAPSYGDRHSAHWGDEVWARTINSHYGITAAA